MQLHNYLIDALDRVLDLDLPDEACSVALSAQVGHLAGIDAEQLSEIDLD